MYAAQIPTTREISSEPNVVCKLLTITVPKSLVVNSSAK